MAVTIERTHPGRLHPLHAVFLAGTATLFLAALLSDWAYASTYQVQWTNFASWLIAGGLLLGAVVLVFALVGLSRADRRQGRYLVYSLLMVVVWVLGFVNALVHAKDAWASMPAALILSVIVAALACVATWIGFSGSREGVTP